ncbi:MAG: mechanosensitive ion channel family protein [Archaeoglobaceae archaeon]
MSLIPDITVYGDIALADLLVIVITMVFAVFIAKIISMNLRKALSDKLKKDELEVLVKVVNILILLIAFVSILPTLGLNLSGLLVAGGVAGIVLGFASQSVVANLISGLFLMSERPVKIGDAVNIANTYAIVVDIHVMSTILRTFEGIYVRMPNETVFTSQIMNLSSNAATRFEYTVGIRYKDDASKAIHIINQIIEDHPLTLKRPSPQIFVNELDDNSVNLTVRIWGPNRNFIWYSLKMELLWIIKRTLEEHGIQVPFPQRTVSFADELGLKKPYGPQEAQNGGQET